ncbi:MAG: signal peptidase I [Propionibacteriaceae bacterium]
MTTPDPDTRRPTGRWRHVLREIALTTGAVLGLVCILAAVAGVALGVQPLIFRSGSMAPEIETGALGLARSVPAAEVVPGDVVSVHGADGVRITHRVVSSEPAGEQTSLVLKGDANEVADAEPYVTDRVDRVLFAVNKAGYVVSWLSSTPAVFVGGALVGALLVYAFDPRGRRRAADEGPDRPESGTPAAASDEEGTDGVDPEGPERDVEQTAVQRSRPAGVVLAVGAMALLAVLVLLPVGSTRAAFTDQATATGGTLSTLTVPAPGTLRCQTLGLAGARFSWSGSTTQRYEITFTPTVGTPTIVLVPAGRNTYSTSTILSVGRATVRTVVNPSGPSPWRSAASNSVGYLVLLGITACA